MTRSTRRGPWLPDEDATLLQLVRSQGPNNWVRIAQHMQNRSPKQCRERYHQNLKPSLNHEPISIQEGEVIEQLVQEMGKRWAEIARRLGNRSDNAVKNWWNGSMNRRKRHVVSQCHSPRLVGPRSQPVSATRPPRVVSLSNHHSSPLDHFRPPYLNIPAIEKFDYGGSSPLGQVRRPTSSTDRTFAWESLKPREQPRPALPLPGKLLPPYDARPSPQLLHHPLSAPISSSLTPESPWSRSVHLQPQSSGSLRPALLNSRIGTQSDWNLPRMSALDTSAISPAATEFSNVPSINRAPSLVSDTQSNCSVSPKTVASPRPSTLAPMESAASAMLEIPRETSVPSVMREHLGPRRYDEGCLSLYSQLPPPDYKACERVYDPIPRRSLSQPIDNSNTARSVESSRTSPANDVFRGERDTRMNVSALLD